MITREEVIRNARTYIHIGGWAPANDVVTFQEMAAKPKFTSCFFKNGLDQEKQVCRTYTVIPYVYGGFDSVTQFMNKISREEIAPGGWDRTTGKTTSEYFIVKEVSQVVSEGEKQVETKKQSKEFLANKYLAGIDCSGYVTRCWSLQAKKGTSTIPPMCLNIRKKDLKEGDALNKAGDHVILFEKWASETKTNALVYESHGGSYKRAFRDGDTKGQVIYHTRAWSWFEGEGYAPYSPFPQIKVVLSSDATSTVRCEGSGDVEVLSVGIDGSSVPVKISKQGSLPKGQGGNFKEAIPQISLAPGPHSFQVDASNRVAGQTFRDQSSLELTVPSG